MASRIKGITVEIGGDTTGLQNALKQVNSSIKSTQSALKDVNKLLKLAPGWQYRFGDVTWQCVRRCCRASVGCCGNRGGLGSGLQTSLGYE